MVLIKEKTCTIFFSSPDVTDDISTAALHDIFDVDSAHFHLLVEIFRRVLPAWLRPDYVTRRDAESQGLLRGWKGYKITSTRRKE